MKPTVVTLSNNTSGSTVYSNPVVVDPYARPGIGLQVAVSGTATWTVQQTLDNVFDGTITPTWFDHPDTNMVSQTVGRQGNYAYPPLAIRLALATASTGSARLTIIQSGITA